MLPSLWVAVSTRDGRPASAERVVAGSAGGWQAQLHDENPQDTGTAVAADGFALDGDKAGEKVTCASALAASGTKEFNLAACAPHDSTSGLTSFVYALTYTYE